MREENIKEALNLTEQPGREAQTSLGQAVAAEHRKKIRNSRWHSVQSTYLSEQGLKAATSS
jgi:hypothetical protein